MHSHPQSLAAAARGAVLWGASFTIFRDIMQFAAMIILVRLLTPLDYGTFALAQSIYILLAMFSAKNFMTHAMQVRDPSSISWQHHYTAGAMLNVTIFGVTLAVAASLLLTNDFAPVAAPLAVLAIGHLIDMPANFAATQLKVAHQWRRFGSLMTIGSFLSLAVSILLAIAGAGVWSLTIGALVVSLPLAVYLYWGQRWKPDWSFDWSSYRAIWRFGLVRTGGAGVLAGRNTTEQAVLAGHYDLAGLGIFTRAVGLANILSGRIGIEVSTALLPVVTRAEKASDRFRRLAALVLQSIAWTTIPTAAFLALASEDVVALLYGPKWLAVAPLLPFAAAHVAMAGIAAGAYNIVLANGQSRTCLFLDAVSAGVALILIFWLVPKGASVYLAAMAAHGGALLLLSALLLKRSGGIILRDLFCSALLPAILASALAVGAVIGARPLFGDALQTVLRVSIEGTLFAAAYAMTLRLLFADKLRELLAVAPAGARASRLLRL